VEGFGRLQPHEKMLKNHLVRAFSATSSSKFYTIG